MSSSILYSRLSLLSRFCFLGLFFNAVPVYSNSESTYECVVREHQNPSTAQHSAITPAQSKPSACRPEYVSKEVCTYMHVAFGLFAWSMELTPAQGSTPSTCRPEYVSKEVCTYMHVAFGLFAWSMELLHLQVACLRQKSWAIYDISHSNPFFFVSERRPPTTRSVIRFTLGWVID